MVDREPKPGDSGCAGGTSVPPALLHPPDGGPAEWQRLDDIERELERLLDRLIVDARLDDEDPPEGYAGLQLSAARSWATIYWKGTPSPAVLEFLKAVPSHLTINVTPARYSLAEMTSALDRIDEDHPLWERGVNGYRPNTDGSGVTVSYQDPRVTNSESVPAEELVKAGAEVHAVLEALVGMPVTIEDEGPGEWM